MSDMTSGGAIYYSYESSFFCSKIVQITDAEVKMDGLDYYYKENIAKPTREELVDYLINHFGSIDVSEGRSGIWKDSIKRGLLEILDLIKSIFIGFFMLIFLIFQIVFSPIVILCKNNKAYNFIKMVKKEKAKRESSK